MVKSYEKKTKARLILTDTVQLKLALRMKYENYFGPIEMSYMHMYDISN